MAKANWQLGRGDYHGRPSGSKCHLTCCVVSSKNSSFGVLDKHSRHSNAGNSRCSISGLEAVVVVEAVEDADGDSLPARPRLFSSL